MDIEFANILQKLVSEQGKEALLNPAKCKAFLTDHTKGEYKKESRLLLQALEAGVPKAIYVADDLEICKKQQIRVLQDEYSLVEETAENIIDVLLLVLRGKVKKDPKVVQTTTVKLSISNEKSIEQPLLKSKKQRHGFTTFWLLLGIIFYSIIIFIIFLEFFFGIGFITDFVLLIFIFLQLISLIFLLCWKKIDFWIIVILNVFLIISFSIYGINISSFIFIIGVLVTYLILKIKKNGKSTWEQLK